MNKSYAEYRIKAICMFYPSGFQVSELHKHHEERDGKFVETEEWKFDITIINDNCGFTSTSSPFSLSGMKKSELDTTFRATLIKVVTMVYDHALYNIHEGDA